MSCRDTIIPISVLVQTAQCKKLAWYSHHTPLLEKNIIQESLFLEKNHLKQKFLTLKEFQIYKGATSFSEPISLDSFSFDIGHYHDITFIYNSISFPIDFMSITDSSITIYALHSTTKVTFYTLLESLLILEFILSKTKKEPRYKYIYLNSNYVTSKPISSLFLFRTFTKRHVVQKQHLLSLILDSLSDIATPTEPHKQIGLHCVKPHECGFKESCWPQLPNDSLYYFHNMSKKEKFTLLNNGIRSMKDCSPDSFSFQQQIQLDCHTKNTTYINKVEIKKFVSKFVYPFYFLDFEAVHFGLPLFENIKPFQALPFQFSLHKQEHKDHVPKHSTFLAEPQKDPRYLFIKELLSRLGNEGSIIAFDTHFEKETLHSLALLFPEFSTAINTLLTRFIDLSLPFQKYIVYSNKMKGRYSLKEILPAFIPELSYTPLSISKGETASRAYVLSSYTTDMAQRKRLLHQLKEYCFLDTYALYRLTELLMEFADND